MLGDYFYSNKRYSLWFSIVNNREAKRIDKILHEQLVPLSRSRIQSLVKEIRIDGVVHSKSSIPKSRQCIEVFFVEPRKRVQEETDTTKSPPKLSVLFENDELLVINKPRGIVVHPGAGIYENTLIQLVRRYLLQSETQKTEYTKEYIDVRASHFQREGLVHRLDKDTSGVLLFAKTPSMLGMLSESFKKRRVHKRYVAICHGVPRSPIGSIEGLLTRNPHSRTSYMISSTKGKYAYTDYRCIAHSPDGQYSFMLFIPRTGRTHQIRVHAKELGIPIVGDRTYATTYSHRLSMMLHAYSLSVFIPYSDSSQRTTLPLEAMPPTSRNTKPSVGSNIESCANQKTEQEGQSHNFMADLPEDFMQALRELSLPLDAVRHLTQ